MDAKAVVVANDIHRPTRYEQFHHVSVQVITEMFWLMESGAMESRVIPVRKRINLLIT